MAKYRRLRDILAVESNFEFVCAPLASPDVIELAHDTSYVERFLDGSLELAALRRIGFPWSEGLVRRTLASVGTEEAFRTGCGAIWPAKRTTPLGTKARDTAFSMTLRWL